MKTLTNSDGASEPFDASTAGASREGSFGAPAEPPRIGAEIAHFRVIAALGQGGMGVVYLAGDLKLRRRVALKVLPAAVASDPERRRRFLREARAASAVAHPNVAAVFEVGEDGDELYLAMEYVEGRTLGDLLTERGGPLDLGEALRIAIAVARGLTRAHEMGIVHRDLKPANVMVGGDGLVKILDFGLAQLAEVPVGGGLEHAPTVSTFATAEGRILGTPGYMAPEQARGGAVDARADVFSFGVMLYELITGARPFGGATAVERLIAADRDAPLPPSARRPGLPEALDRLVMRCLEKRPEDRFTSFGEIAEILEGTLHGAPPRTTTATPRRRRVGLAGLGIGAVVAALAGAAWIARSRPAPASVAPVSSAPPVASASPALALVRRPCLEGEPGATACGSTTVVAWCDSSGRPVGCCGHGLVPTGADGICVCAPGGTSVSEAIARGCAAAPADHEEAHRRVHQDAVSKAIACFQPGFREGRAKGGTFAADYFLTPEGQVFGARVNRSTVPDEKAQACVLDVLRGTRFPPPRGEDAGRQLGFGFEFEQ